MNFDRLLHDAIKQKGFMNSKHADNTAFCLAYFRQSMNILTWKVAWPQKISFIMHGCQFTVIFFFVKRSEIPEPCDPIRFPSKDMVRH